VFRLFQILSPESSVSLPESIAQDVERFLSLVQQEPPDIKSLGIKNVSPEQIAGRLKEIYHLYRHKRSGDKNSR